ncbi:hypothetical protein NVP1161O_144 [Vibrio phage 1.161.O._10N.261.48.C5]|nr:hypothetical protein NVP1161O_144 [Vibrio phage 1.161.O._10N.261.48.C5]
MFDSELKLRGLDLSAIINEGVHGNLEELSVEDWLYLEHLYQEDVGYEMRRAYLRGYYDGRDKAWDEFLGDDEE